MSYFEYKFEIGARRFGNINWLGFFTLLNKEVQRFLNVWIQTIISPIITFLLFFMVFSLAIGNEKSDVLGYHFTTFLIPGLIIMQMIQNAFANTSSSVMIGKVQGTIVDILYPPLSPAELSIAIIFGGMVRGLMIGIVSTILSVLFFKIPIFNIGYIIIFSVLGTVFLSSLGLICGLWADKFEQMAAMTNFFIVPLTFISGVFFSINKFHNLITEASHYNPFFYIVDGFRYGFLGVADGNLHRGLVILIFLNFLTLWICYILFKKGYKIKS